MKKLKSVARNVSFTAHAPRPISQKQGQPPEKVKTSILLANPIFLKAKDRAREIGVSFNAFVTVALNHELERVTQARTAPTMTDEVLRYFMERDRGHAPVVTPAPSPPVPSLAERLKKFGPGFRYKEGDDDWFATWDQVEEYARVAAEPEHDGATFLGLGTLFPEWSYETVRAADMAISMPIYQEYLKAKYPEDFPPKKLVLKKKKKGGQ